jgi:hypothetical protein
MLYRAAVTSATVEVSIKGKLVARPALHVDGTTVVVGGRWLRVAAIHDEYWTEHGRAEIDACLRTLTARRPAADLFAFTQRLPDVTPQFPYPFELVHEAAIPITTYDEWWNTRLSHDTRKVIRRSARRGLVVRVVDFDDALVAGIKAIYDETPVRQGKAFWHYRKTFDTVKRENATYLERSTFLGAYYDGELIGFMKLVSVGAVAASMQLLSMTKHHDKYPSNALIAAAIEHSARRGRSFLTYGEYRNRNQQRESSLTGFKRHNGFEDFAVPRFYAPLTRRGRLAVALGLHRDLLARIPPEVVNALITVRARWATLRHLRAA